MVWGGEVEGVCGGGGGADVIGGEPGEGEGGARVETVTPDTKTE